MELNTELVNKFTYLLKKAYEESFNINDMNINKKEKNDIVTDIDIYMEDKIIEAINNWYPSHSIYCEESGSSNKDSEYCWFVDPIDGTVNFASELPIFSTAITLKYNDEIIFSIVLDYNNDKVYHAIKDLGAFCNNEPIKVSEEGNLKNCIIGFGLTSEYSKDQIESTLDFERNIVTKVRSLRLIGSSAIELCWLASGKLEGFLKLKPSMGLGTMAGKFIAKEAGAMITNSAGEEQKDIDTILVSNGLIHIKILKNI